MEAIWKDIKKTGNKYQVCNLGHVRSFTGTRIPGYVLKNQINSVGYYAVCLYGTSHLVHRLVYEMFIGPLVKGLVIDHIDHNKLNNRADNLQQITQRENLARERRARKRRQQRKLATGVSKLRDHFIARISHNRKEEYLGYFKTEQEASEAYQKRLKEITNLP